MNTNKWEYTHRFDEYFDFEKELSVIVARNENGETKVYPTVECEFSPEANLVEFLFSPADVTPAIEKAASATKIINNIFLFFTYSWILFSPQTNLVL